MHHDRLFKHLLTQFFFDFFELFAPQTAREADPDSLVFLDKEAFLEEKRREADVVARLKVAGSDRVYLVHVEHQSSNEDEFPRRMFGYFSRLFDRYGCDVYPIALLPFRYPQSPQPDELRLEFPDLEPLLFRYKVIQLNRLPWQSYRIANPVAAALMSRMRMKDRDRPWVFLACLSLIARMKDLGPRDQSFLAGFVDQSLRLSPEEKAVCQAELNQMDRKDREAVLEYVNPWKQEARQEGRHEGLCKAVQALVETRFGSAVVLADRLGRLEEEQLLELIRLLGSGLPIEQLEAFFEQ